MDSGPHPRCFLAIQRLAYRKYVHKKFTKRICKRHETSREKDSAQVCKHSDNECSHVQFKRNTVLKHSNNDASLVCNDDTNNSAGKQVKVREYGKRTKDDTTENLQCNKSRSLHGLGIHNSDVKSEMPLGSATRTFSVGKSTAGDTSIKKGENDGCLAVGRKLPDLPVNNIHNKEAELSSMIDEIREAQRDIRKQIRDLEDDIENKMAEGAVTSDDLAELNNDIVQFKVAVIQEARKFEDFIQINASDEVNIHEPCLETNSQLNRIKSVNILNDCIKDLEHVTDVLDKDLDKTVTVIKKEIEALEEELFDLTRRREDIIRQKIDYLDSTDGEHCQHGEICSRTKAYEEQEHKTESYITKPPSYKHTVSGNNEILSYSHVPTDVRKRSLFADLLCFGREVTQENDTNSQEDMDSTVRSEQHNKWAKLDRQYKKHSEKIRKRSELAKASKKYVTAKLTADKRLPKKQATKRLSFKFKFKVPWNDLGKQKIRSYTNHLKQGVKDMGKVGRNNLKHFREAVVKCSVCQPTKEYMKELKNDAHKRIKELNAGLRRLCERLLKQCRPIINTMHECGKGIRENINALSVHYTEMKRNFRHPKKSEFPDRKANRPQTSISHIREFLSRLRLVAKYRNVLMFDREILLPQRRLSLFEWYDLPMAVVYGVERFHQIENRFQRQLFAGRDEHMDECRYDLRVYGPMEYQLGRALNYNEIALLQEEKIAMLKKAVYRKTRKRKKASRTQLALAQINDYSCISCLRCFKDCIFGCKNVDISDNGEEETEQFDNERTIGGHPIIAEEFIRQISLSSRSTLLHKAELSALRSDVDRFVDDMDGFERGRYASIRDNSDFIDRTYPRRHSLDTVRFRTEDDFVQRNIQRDSYESH